MAISPQNPHKGSLPLTLVMGLGLDSGSKSSLPLGWVGAWVGGVGVGVEDTLTAPDDDRDYI